MTTRIKHENQYKKNISLLQYDPFSSDKCKYKDWKITIIFYAAVHIVEMKLAEFLGEEVGHTSNHKSRNNIIMIKKEFQTIKTQYMALYRLSRETRYDCIDVKDRKVESAIKCLEHIKKELNIA